MTPVADSERERIVKLVQECLKKHQPNDYRLEVVPDGVQQDGDWYYVVVQPSREDVSYEYYGLLTDAETDLQERESMKILLVPAIPS